MTRKIFTINMDEKRQCVISFASKGREDYNQAMERNIIQAKKHYNGDFLYYSLDQGNRTVAGELIRQGLPENCPPHQVVPYGFKPYLFQEAYNLGYRQILWMDSTVMMMSNPAPVFERMKSKGVVAFHNLGHNLPAWISDKAVKNTGIDVYQEPTQIMACVVGFDLSHPEGKEIFDEWMALAKDGESFQDNPGSWPGFKAHRHDQACLSALLWKHEVKLLPYGNLVYETHKDGYKGKTIFFMNKAIGQ